MMNQIDRNRFIPTPHNRAKSDDFAKTVLMPGDPLRAKFMAENFLQQVRLVNDIRGMLGFTGIYHGKPVSVMGSGMGIPSMGIYSYELFHYYDVEQIIRLGSAGGLSSKVALMDVVMGIGACTDSNYAAQFELGGTIAPICDFSLAMLGVAQAHQQGIQIKTGNLLSSDVFYQSSSQVEKWTEMGVLAVEMETAALYLNAMKAGKKALSICTISDHILTGESLDATARQTSFTKMMTLALEMSIQST